jgi:hypothetical protein
MRVGLMSLETIYSGVKTENFYTVNFLQHSVNHLRCSIFKTIYKNQ